MPGDAVVEGAVTAGDWVVTAVGGTGGATAAGGSATGIAVAADESLPAGAPVAEVEAGDVGRVVARTVEAGSEGDGESATVADVPPFRAGRSVVGSTYP
ncbi:MAG TPA: hypothetical protein VLV28_01865 [Gaiellaceae bacterium]|nr:hypothetical protein [Gaiellaceae bacterium]